ncbi:choice-of-anchor J domain-containing protein, partial [Myroides indicus]
MKKITTIVSVVVFLICSVLVYAINKEYNAGNFLFNILEKKEVTLSHKEVDGRSLFVDKKSNNETQDALLFASYAEDYEVTGTCLMLFTTTYVPMYSTSNATAVNRTAVIYPASQLVGVAGQELESIYFNRNGTNDPTGSPKFKVYLKETASIDFGSGAWTWDTTGATLVYDSNPLSEMSGGAGWKKFAFSTKFTYSGTQNLMVLMEYENGGNTTSVSWEYEYGSPCVDTSNSNTTKYNNNTTGTLSTSLVSSDYRRPHIKLGYSVSCASPEDLAVSTITTNGATISWNKGGTETAWEYAVQPAGQGIPTSYTPATSTSINVTGLSPATSYEVYVRSDCGSTDGKSVWKMETFGTSCGIITSSLWWEGFNSDSASLDCWTIVDENNDSTSPTGSNIWKTSATSYEGSHSMYFYGAQSDATKRPHNDWLISPPIKMQAGKQYRLKYHYRTTSTTSYDYEFAVLISTTGSDSTSKFTTSIVPKKKYTPSTAWFEEYLIIDGVNADVNIAWHVTSSSQYTYLYLDNVFIEEVTGCPEPMDLDVKGVGSDTATLFWTDNFGATAWEYYVQKTGGGKPTVGGTATTTKEVTVTKDASGVALEDNTEYEYYVRTSCGGGEYSIWQGPFTFRTQCASFSIPFWEGFNTDSKTLDCWTIVDGNGDSTSPTGSNIWRTYTISPMEGDQQMYFYGTSAGAPHDDWLISPAFTLDATKVYKLTYRYKTNTSYNNDFEVLLSKGGISPNDFTTTILSKTHSSSTEEEETLFIGGISGDVNLAWHVTTPSSATYLYLDDVTLVEVDCVDPMNLGVKDIESNKATIVWEDDFNASWEYVVQEEGDGYPGGAGTSVTANEAAVTKTNSGATLKPNVEYEFYVRSKCTDGTFGDWIGPFVFKTECSAVSWPFTETFETNSTTVDCWTVLDVGSDGSGTTTKTNTWGLYSSSTYAYEGTYSMRFYGTSAGAPFDDWLISPIIQMKNTDIYQLTYYYRTNASYENNFEVKLSTKGTDPSQFTTTLLASDTYKNGDYEKKILYITGVDGDANIGWHVTASNSSYTYVYLDNIKLEKIDCIGPEDDITISDLEIDKAKFNWTDTENSQWETYVQAAGSGKPTGSGTLVTSKPVTVTRTNGTGSGNLQPNTEYEFWVRSTCGPGKNSGWVGPFTFRTPCDTQVLPFWEGFNKDSKTIDCWNIIDGNGDSTSSTAGIWHMNSTNYEGDQSARFYGSSSANLPHNDWLMSPTFTLDPSKYYRLKYHYRTTSTTSYEYEFEVLLSDSGIDKTSNFTDVVVPKKKYDPSTTWEEKIAIISGVSGNINLAWHVTSSTQYTYVYIDNVFLEEIDCPQPVELGSKDEKEEKATIYWQDNFGSDWEFIVQEAGGSTPLPTATGSNTKNKEVVVTKDKNGDNLASNTEYEFYVRTGCGNGKYGEWSGPYIFKTACGVFTTP